MTLLKSSRSIHFHFTLSFQTLDSSNRSFVVQSGQFDSCMDKYFDDSCMGTNIFLQKSSISLGQSPALIYRFRTERKQQTLKLSFCLEDSQSAVYAILACVMFWLFASLE